MRHSNRKYDYIKNKDIKFIAMSLGISEGTVKNILTRLKKKKQIIAI